MIKSEVSAIDVSKSIENCFEVLAKFIKQQPDEEVVDWELVFIKSLIDYMGESRGFASILKLRNEVNNAVANNRIRVKVVKNGGLHIEVRYFKNRLEADGWASKQKGKIEISNTNGET